MANEGESQDIQITQISERWKTAPRMYSNNVQMLVSQWDVMLYIGETVPLPGPNNTVVGADLQPRVVLTMSREHFRSFAAAAQKTLESIQPETPDSTGR